MPYLSWDNGGSQYTWCMVYPCVLSLGWLTIKVVKHAKTSQTLHFLKLFEEIALKYHIFMSKLNRN